MNQKGKPLAAGQFALIELVRSDIHRMIDEKVNHLLYHTITQNETEISDSVAVFSSDTTALKGAKPISVVFQDGREEETTTWKKLAAAILRECDSDPEMHDRLMRLRGVIAGKNRVILSADPGEMDAPIQINDDLYFESKFDTASLLLVLKARVLDAVGYDHCGILIRYQAQSQNNDLGKRVPEEDLAAWREIINSENPESEAGQMTAPVM